MTKTERLTPASAPSTARAPAPTGRSAATASLYVSMQSQKPSWRKACSWPVGGEPLERLALQHAVLGEVVERRPARSTKKPPLTHCSARGFSRKPRHAAVVAVDLRDAELQLGPHDRHRRQVAVARGAPRAARAGRCRRRRRRRWRRSGRSPSAARPASTRPPVGVSRPGVEALDGDAVRPAPRRARSARSARPCSRCRAGSGGSPARA